MNTPIVHRLCRQALANLQIHTVGGVFLLMARSGIHLPARGLFTSDGVFSDAVRAEVNRSHRTWLPPASARGSFLGGRCKLQTACLVGSANLVVERRRAEAGKKRRIDAEWKASLIDPWAAHVSSVFFTDDDQTAEASRGMLLLTLARQPDARMLRAFLLGAVQGDETLHRVNTRLETPAALADAIRQVFVGTEVESFAFHAEADTSVQPPEAEAYLPHAV